MLSKLPKLMGISSLLEDVDDPRKYMKYNVFMVRTMGLLPHLAAPGRCRLASVALNWAVWTWMGLHVLSELCDIYRNIFNLSALAKNVTVTGVVAGAWLRHTIYSRREADYYSLVETVSKNFVSIAFASCPQRCSMTRWIRQSKLTFVVYFMYGCVVALYWLCHPIFSPAKLLVEPLTNTTREVWDFPCGAWYPFDASQPRIYGMVYFFQSVAIFLGGCMIMVTDMMFISLTLLICGQLEILKDSLRSIMEIATADVLQDTSDTKREAILKKFSNNNMLLQHEINTVLAWCVEHHNMLLRLIADVESLHWASMLINFSLQLVILSFLALEATTATDSNNPMKVTNIVSYLILAVLQLFLLCRSGDQLMDQEGSVAGAVYESRWYDCPESFQKSLRIVVLRARHPVQVTAGKVAPLDLDTFSETLSRAFSYFTVLRQLRGGP